MLRGPLELANLVGLMQRTRGSAVVIGLVDGPVAADRPELSGADIRPIHGAPLLPPASRSPSFAVSHGTFIAGILCAQSSGICPDATLLVRPILFEATDTDSDPSDRIPAATPKDLARAVADCVEAGAHVMNLSVGLPPGLADDATLGDALSYAADQGVVVAAAAGNHGMIGSSTLTRHPAVIPVGAARQDGQPLASTNLSRSAALLGLLAPGEQIAGMGVDGAPFAGSGSSAAVPFVVGAAALLMSLFPDAGAAAIRNALIGPRRGRLIPPRLDAEAAFRRLSWVEDERHARRG
jgi:subtilisin family serine protease